MSSRVAELAYCVTGCGFRQCRRFKGLCLCQRCWPKRGAILALKEHQEQEAREKRREEKKVERRNQ